MGNRIDFALRPTSDPVALDARENTMITGNTGAGKTTAVKSAMAALVGDSGPEVQFIVLNPKIVGWSDAQPRMHVYTSSDEWLQCLVGLNDEIDRRYRVMADAGISDFRASEDMPRLMLVVEEAPAIIGSSSMLVKREADEARSLLMRLVRMARQAGGSVWVISQSGFTESVPSGIRGNLVGRVVMRAGSDEESAAASGRPADEVRASMLIPGEAYVLSSYTNQRFVRCRALSPKAVDFAGVMRRKSGDKRPLIFLEERGLSG